MIFLSFCARVLIDLLINQDSDLYLRLLLRGRGANDEPY